MSKSKLLKEMNNVAETQGSTIDWYLVKAVSAISVEIDKAELRLSLGLGSAPDPVITIDSQVESNTEANTWTGKRDLVLILLDAEKALDRIQWDYMWRLMDKTGFAWVTSVWVMSLFQCTAAQLSITPDVVTAVVGDTVTLSVQHDESFEYVTWYRDGRTCAYGIIIDLVGRHPPFYGHQYTGREAMHPDGSLWITDVKTDHTGNYTVKMNLSPGGLQTATAQLRVHGDSPASDASCSSWWVTLAVASGMLLGAVVAVLGVVLFYERRAKKANGATLGGSPRAIYESAVKYENVEKGNRAVSAL
ncbi:uncharacterized protein LOC144767825 [Lissotriton helveticus]